MDTNSENNFTPSCPSSSNEINHDQFNPYAGDPSFFHCGFQGFVGEAPINGGLQQECFYDQSGMFVGNDHPYAGCGGSPNEHDADTDTFNHTVSDRGGVFSSDGITPVAWDGFITSKEHTFDQNMENIGRSIEHVADSIESAYDEIADYMWGDDGE
jgi:hypothetical protein